MWTKDGRFIIVCLVDRTFRYSIFLNYCNNNGQKIFNILKTNSLLSGVCAII